MSEENSNAPSGGEMEEDAASNHKGHAAASPPFNPMASPHVSEPGVHSVVPDLMRVYESLTKTNPHDHREGHRHDQQQQPPDSHPQQPLHRHQDAQYLTQAQALHQPGLSLDAQQPQAQQQHVDYSYVTTEEQYRQLYVRSQSAQHLHSNPMGQQQQHFQRVQIPCSLPCIPVPYEDGNKRNNSQRGQAAVQEQPMSSDPENARSSEDGSSRPPSSASVRRKRALQDDHDPSSSATSRGGTSKGRKKAKETDGRWLKRFTWPENLHKDFVSAVFDVGLKHSSPSTILEHMPKHPQINAERIKSHLQKYRVHREKSKQEFMSSYESTLKELKTGKMDKATSLTGGEVAAHITHVALAADASPTNTSRDTLSASKSDATILSEQQIQQQQKLPSRGSAESYKSLSPVPGHEALMLPKLTEAEKMSPIGASMGYLLGLFFSLKKQLLIQRSLNASSNAASATKASAAGSPPHSDPTTRNGTVSIAYNSFGGTSNSMNGTSAPNATGNTSNSGKMIPSALPPPLIPMTSPPVMANADWSAGSSTVPSLPAVPASAGDQAQSAPVPNPMAVQTGSTRTNLQASTIMKREMQNQMAFQNKMRALKQQELNKFEGANNNAISSTNEDSSSAYHNSSNHHHHEQQQDPSVYTNDGHHSKDSHLVAGPSSGLPDNSHVHHGDQHVQQGLSQAPQEPPVSHIGGNYDGDPQPRQGAGDTASDARARAPSFSMGGNDDFWNADVMDEQLFEFLMNN